MRAGRAGRTGAIGLVGRVGCARDVRGAEGRQACVAGEEKLRRVSPELKKGVLRGSQREAGVLTGWAARSWLRGENVRNKPRTLVGTGPIAPARKGL